MDESTTKKSTVCIVLCDSDRANLSALKQALRSLSICGKFVIVGESAFIKDCQSPFAFQAEFVKNYDTTQDNLLLFDAAALAAEIADDAEAVSRSQKLYESAKSAVDRVRAYRTNEPENTRPG